LFTSTDYINVEGVGMAVSHAKDRRRMSGGRVGKKRDKRKSELGRDPALTKVSAYQKIKKIRAHGGNTKNRVLHALYANVLDPKTKKAQKAKILTEKSNPANRNFARGNILTKGAIIETEAGDAKITSRPGQDGTINAILLEKK